MNKIVTIVGARPQFIKAATVSRALAASGVKEIIVHTGQHFDENMSDVFFEEMEIPRPQYQLDIHGLSHGAMTGRMMEKIESLLIQEKPDYVLVYGDTNSTLAGALAAVKLHIPVAHVEAGLRSYDMHMPEEINRILTDRISSMLFCPTDDAVSNLKKEGFEQFDCQIEKTGDVMFDAVKYYKDKAIASSKVLEKYSLKSSQFVLATLHRAENTDNRERLKAVMEALNEISKTIPVILPLHPRTKQFLTGLQIATSIQILPPVSYFDMLMLLNHCKLVLTDSGGLQKEAYFFEKFCITLRDQTEWVELVAAGANEIAGADPKRIVESFKKNLDRVVTQKALYGDGKAAMKIAARLTSPPTPLRAGEG